MDHLKGLIMIGDGMCISQCENLRIFSITQILYEIISELTLRKYSSSRQKVPF